MGVSARTEFREWAKAHADEIHADSLDEVAMAFAAGRATLESALAAAEEGYQTLALFNEQVAAEAEKAGLGHLPTPVAVEQLRERAEGAERERKLYWECYRRAVAVYRWMRSHTVVLQVELATAKEMLERDPRHPRHRNA